jgi:hypothetical protein
LFAEWLLNLIRGDGALFWGSTDVIDLSVKEMHGHGQIGASEFGF